MTLLVNELSCGQEILERLLIECRTSPLYAVEIENKQLKEFKTLCSKARDAWALAVFTASRKELLERYFNYHLRVITGLYTKLSTLLLFQELACSCQDGRIINHHFETELHKLIDHLFSYFGEYTDINITAPESYRRYFIQNHYEEAATAKQLLETANLPKILKATIISYVEGLSGNKETLPLAFGELLYLKNFLKAMNSVVDYTVTGSTAAFADKLLELEFNQVEVFIYLQDEISATLAGKTDDVKIALLEKQELIMGFYQKVDTLSYDPRWPKLSVMLSDWLSTEIRCLKELRAAQLASCQTNTYKLKLELSVAHLACLLRLLVKEGLSGAIPLTDLFRFICEKFRTKRAETLSVGGLSKEYYSVNQVTAAEVKGLLVKMINRINRDYFPVVVVISVLICAC